eukprot:TRINITY_DN28_c0_g1_i8.p1 TRINITY_DN28_c0_g1~~TRINITY_DN28_c0_g1_i8.p1  ORF type:complete len:1060 (+),score=291.53 TRINITY_DN28_c0_g1_i8:96-3275(+)
MPIATQNIDVAATTETSPSLQAEASAYLQRLMKKDREAARDLVNNIVKKEGFKALITYDIMKTIKANAEDKKNHGAREGAFFAINTLAEVMEASGLPYLLPLFTVCLDGVADKQKVVAKTAEQAVQTIFKITPAYAFKVILPQLLAALDNDKQWTTKVSALKIIQKLCTTCKAQVDKSLPTIIPVVSACMWDTKTDVQKAAALTLTAVCQSVNNPDLHPFIDILVETIKEPSQIPETVYKLSSTTFVTTVEAPSLAIMAPILGRGLLEPSPVVLRQTSVIIDNMCKLVEDPIHAEQFLPKLMPGLNRVIATGADPELRNVATRAKTTLVRVGGGKEEIPEEDTTATAQKLKEALAEAEMLIKAAANGVLANTEVDADTLAFIGAIVVSLDASRDYTNDSWTPMCIHYTNPFTAEQAKNVADNLQKKYKELSVRYNKAAEVYDKDEGEELCNCEFSLAYGGMILLNNAKLRLTRGQRYGLCGPNGVGKSTLMRAIANGQLDGFPGKDVLKTVFVEHNLQASDAEKPVLEFVSTDPEFAGMDISNIKQALMTVGFNEERQAQAVGALSGGWKMKLELARAMLLKADILLLDEPTNHLDVTNVAWLTNYLNSLTTATSIIVSHDSKFLDDVCTHILHYEHRKLGNYKGNLSKFVEIKPEAKSYYELSAARFTFKFPEPGFLDGVKSSDKAILKMTNVGYTYPNTTKMTIRNISVQCSLSSRVAVVGPNGAGKSSMIKVLTGEVEPTVGEVWKHPNLRVAYVAQHAFHHIEHHLDKTPNEYIRWRYEHGEDKELAGKITRQLSEEDEKKFYQIIVIDGEKRKMKNIVSRRKAKRSFEYEIEWQGKTWEDNSWLSREKLESLGIQKILQIFDDREAARAGLYIRPLTSINVQKHLQDIGLDPEFATHSRIRGLSGGQKVKVVIGAAMWDNPHILVLDEPTNYLDRDSLGALASAIKEYKGGVIMITHHHEFSSALCPETWKMDDGNLNVDGGVTPVVVEKIEMKEQLTATDAHGNTVKVKSTRTLSRKERITRQKGIMAKVKNGESLDSDEEEEYYEMQNATKA